MRTRGPGARARGGPGGPGGAEPQGGGERAPDHGPAESAGAAGVGMALVGHRGLLGQDPEVVPCEPPSGGSWPGPGGGDEPGPVAGRRALVAPAGVRRVRSGRLPGGAVAGVARGARAGARGRGGEAERGRHTERTGDAQPDDRGLCAPGGPHPWGGHVPTVRRVPVASL